MDLIGANVFIIGGSSGMGFAAARLAKEGGAHVTIAGRSSRKLQLAAQQLGDIRAVTADITSESGVQAIFAETDRVDHVFITAGRLISGKIVEAELEILRSDVEQRFWGPIHVIRQAAPKMSQGSITLLSGLYATRPATGEVINAAMNAAIEGLARGLALELAPVRVNAIAPALIDTPLLEEYREEAAKWAAGALPVKRMGLAEEVAQAVILLMTNGFITGEVLHMDGGARLV